MPSSDGMGRSCFRGHASNPPAMPHGMIGQSARFTSSDTPGLSGCITPSSVRVPSGNMMTARPSASAFSTALIPSVPTSRSMGTAPRARMRAVNSPFTGPLPNGPTTGSLVLVGDGSKRDDRIAVVAGPSGPVAEAELRAEAPGISAKLLDSYTESLTKELAAATA